VHGLEVGQLVAQPTWGGSGTRVEQDGGGGGGDLWTKAGRASGNHWADRGARREILEAPGRSPFCPGGMSAGGTGSAA
jgi:hypothetical protein